MSRIGWVFRKTLKAAGRILQSRSRTLRMLSSATRLARQHENPLRAVWESLATLIRMVRAWASGGYRDVPWRSLTFATAAILYFVSPLDAIPDFIPVAGFLDDAMVIAWVAGAIRKDLDRFEDWESSSLLA